MKKQVEFSGVSALNFVENLEARISQLEIDAEQNWQEYYVARTTSEFFKMLMEKNPERCEQDREYFLANTRDRILSNLLCYLEIGDNPIRTREDVEWYAYRIQLQKAAERICARYDIELN